MTKPIVASMRLSYVRLARASERALAFDFSDGYNRWIPRSQIRGYDGNACWVDVSTWFCKEENLQRFERKTPSVKT